MDRVKLAAENRKQHKENKFVEITEDADINPVIKVIFRKYKNAYTGEYNIIAFFPESYNFGDVMSYEHIGQHSKSSILFYRETKPASLNEYLPLYQELTQKVGYNLRVMKRFNY